MKHPSNLTYFNPLSPYCNVEGPQRQAAASSHQHC